MRKINTKSNPKFFGILIILALGLIFLLLGYLLLNNREKLELGEFTLTDLTVKVVDKNSQNTLLDDNFFPQNSDLYILLTYKGADKNTKLKITIKSTDDRNITYSKTYSETITGDGEEKIEISKTLSVGTYQITASQGDTKLSVYNFAIE